MYIFLLRLFVLLIFNEDVLTHHTTGGAGYFLWFFILLSNDVTLLTVFHSTH